jgi:hypothetical protein
MNEEDRIDSLIDDLVAMGALIKNPEPVNGEFVYNVNTKRMEEVFPSFNSLFMQEVEDSILSLFEQGLVTIEYDENLKAMYSLTEAGKSVVDAIVLSDRPDDF